MGARYWIRVRQGYVACRAGMWRLASWQATLTAQTCSLSHPHLSGEDLCRSPATAAEGWGVAATSAGAAVGAGDLVLLAVPEGATDARETGAGS